MTHFRARPGRAHAVRLIRYIAPSTAVRMQTRMRACQNPRSVGELQLSRSAEEEKPTTIRTGVVMPKLVCASDCESGV